MNGESGWWSSGGRGGDVVLTCGRELVGAMDDMQDAQVAKGEKATGKGVAWEKKEEE